MTQKLYEKYQEPKTRFVADWLWRILALLGVAFLSWAQLWGDARYITREEFPKELSSLVESVMTKIEPRLSSVEKSVTQLNHNYVTKREYDATVLWIKEALIRIERKLP